MAIENNIRAQAKYVVWRGQGVPNLITAHEAFMLTDGRIGKENDHSTPIDLEDLAIRDSADLEL